MRKIDTAQLVSVVLSFVILAWALTPAAAAVRLEGQVQAGGGPVANSAVTLWATSAGEPRQLAQTKTGSDGRFELDSQETLGADAVLYVDAAGRHHV